MTIRRDLPQLVGLALAAWVMGGVFGGVDVHNAEVMAQHFWLRPSHTFSAEYPPLAIVVYAAGLLPAPAAALMAEMLLVLVATYALIARFWPGRQRAFAAYVVIAAPCLLLSRYDLVPAALTVGALAAALRKRFALAYVLLALGTALKLYPALLVPLVVIAQYRGGDGARRVAGALSAGLLVLLAVYGGALLLGGHSAIQHLTFAAQRPPQDESTAGVLIGIAAHLGVPARSFAAFGSPDVTSSLAGPLQLGLSAVLGVFFVGACACLWMRRVSLGMAMVVVLAAAIATNKVLSPQYLLWLLPLVAVEEGLTPGWLAVAVLTFLDYPFLFGLNGLGHFPPPLPALPFLVVVGARDALVLVLAGRRLLAIAQRPDRVRLGPDVLGVRPDDPVEPNLLQHVGRPAGDP